MFRTDYEAAYHWRVVGDNFLEARRNREEAARYREEAARLKEISRQCRAFTAFVDEHGPKYREEIAGWIGKINELWDKYYDQSVNRAGYEAGYNAALAILKEERDHLSIPWETARTRINGAIDAAVKARENGERGNLKKLLEDAPPEVPEGRLHLHYFYALESLMGFPSMLSCSSVVRGLPPEEGAWPACAEAAEAAAAAEGEPIARAASLTTWALSSPEPRACCVSALLCAKFFAAAAFPTTPLVALTAVCPAVTASWAL
jgi:hypothetical protein